MAILFLDFDGVLHDLRNVEIRYFEGRPTVTGKDLFCYAPLLASLLQQATRRVEVVISSSWKNHFTLDELKARLGDVAPFVLGSTRELPPGVRCDSRFEECATFARQRGEDDWIMVDDSPDIVWGCTTPRPEHLARVIWCDPEICLPDAVEALEGWLT